MPTTDDRHEGDPVERPNAENATILFRLRIAAGESKQAFEARLRALTETPRSVRITRKWVQQAMTKEEWLAAMAWYFDRIQKAKRRAQAPGGCCPGKGGEP